MTVARNIRVIDLMRVLSNYNTSQFVDITIILGRDNEPDKIKISGVHKNGTNKDGYSKFKFKNLNDYI